MDASIRSELQALYSELGSEERVFALMLGFYEALARDTMIGFFFSGKDLEIVSRKQAEFLLRAMGARSTYSGKPPAQAHDQLAPILPGHFDRRAIILENFLQHQGLSPRAIRAWVDFEEAFRDAVVSDCKMRNER
jgi:truncated hemoglobin YjbI